MQASCCDTQHTYAHAQQLLTRLGRHERGVRFQRLSQELEMHAATLHGAVVWRMHHFFVDSGAWSTAQQHDDAHVLMFML